MRVVHVVALVSDDGAYGGPPTVAVGQLTELARRGHDVTLAALWRGAGGPPPAVEGVPARLFPARTVVPGTGVLGQLSAGLLGWLWRELPCADVLHVHGGRNLVTVATLLVAAARRVPYVVQTHGMVMPRRHPRARLLDLLLVPLLRRARHRLVLTSVEGRGLSEVVGPGAPVTRLANGVDVPANPGRRLGDPPRVVFLARLHPSKRVLAFLDAAELLVERGSAASFTVYGPDEGDRPAVRARLARPPLAGRVTDGGALDHEAALDMLAAADVYVLPSRDDPFPVSVLEALSRGTPAVCTTSCGVADGLAGSGAGVVTDGSPVALADAVQGLLADPGRWRAASDRAVDTARTGFSLPAVADRLLDLYGSARR